MNVRSKTSYLALHLLRSEVLQEVRTREQTQLRILIFFCETRQSIDGYRSFRQKAGNLNTFASAANRPSLYADSYQLL